MSHPSLSVVIPLFNEEENVCLLQQELADALSTFHYEVIFVDDGSTDQTAAKIPNVSHVHWLQFSKNQGQSAAMLAGIRAARADIIVTLDGDLQNDPHDIPHLIEILNQGADLVCGYRIRRADSTIKRLTSRIANAVRGRFVGDGVRDTGCTLKAMRRHCIHALVPFNGVHRFIPALIKAAGFCVVETPVHHRPRRFGTSKYGLGNRALRATIDMLGVRWLQTRQIHPEKAHRISGKNSPSD